MQMDDAAFARWDAAVNDIGEIKTSVALQGQKVDKMEKHMERSNGNQERLQARFDQKMLDDAKSDGHMQGTVDTLSSVMRWTFLMIAGFSSIATIAAVAFGIAKFFD